MNLIYFALHGIMCCCCCFCHSYAVSGLGLHCLSMSQKWDARLIWAKHRDKRCDCIHINRPVSQTNIPFWLRSHLHSSHETERRTDVYHINKYEPGHEKMCLMPYANNKGADQPAHPRSLISAFVVRCQDRMIPVVYISDISRF